MLVHVLTCRFHPKSALIMGPGWGALISRDYCRSGKCTLLLPYPLAGKHGKLRRINEPLTQTDYTPKQ